MKAAFTICTPAYLPYAKALGDSICEHNPDYVFHIFYLESVELNINFDFFQPYVLHKIESLEIVGFEEMKSRYNNFELCCALKPFIAELLLLDNKKIEKLFYFDSDILVFNTLNSAEKLLNTHPFLITPHLIEPMKEDGFFPKEEVIVQSGLYNAGFFGMNNQSEGLSFLAWWKERLFSKCFVKLQEGLFVDQVWLTSAVYFFPQIFVFKNPGYNFAYWNFQERVLSIVNEKFMINNSFPLVFMHFSGYDIQNPEMISKHQNRFTFHDKPETRALFQKYQILVLKNNFADLINCENFSEAEGKTKLTPMNKKKWFSSLFRKKI